MDFLREFIKRVLCIIGAKILANPLSFLGVTGIFIIVLYTSLQKSGETNFNKEEYIALIITYIIALSVFMDKKAVKFKKNDDASGDKIQIKQNNFSIFNFFKNTKK